MESLFEVESKYKWEKNASQWEGVQEDEEGNIVAAVSDREKSHRAKARRITSSIRRGLIRYLVVNVDCSTAALEKDLRPTKYDAINLSLRKFIAEYFDQNPISQICLTITKDKISEKLTELSGNPKYHENKLLHGITPTGEASLQNSILLSMNILNSVPEYGTREVLIIFNSLKTRDPGDIYETIEYAKKLKIRINIICTSAELYICKKICEETGGLFHVITDIVHLHEILVLHTVPPPDMKRKEQLTTDFIYMGFPKRNVQSSVVFATDSMMTKLVTSSYICPRCSTRCTELPSQCSVCRLQLTSSSHIAKSHHHLFPIPNFHEYTILINDQNELYYELSESSSSSSSSSVSTSADMIHNSSATTTVITTVSNSDHYDSYPNNQNYHHHHNGVETRIESKPNIITTEIKNGNHKSLIMLHDTYCAGCLKRFQENMLLFQCPMCTQLYCIDCDLFIHDTLHNCPTCC